MKVFLPWLKEYIDSDLPQREELAEKLTFAGLEVEGIERYGEGLDQIIVARVDHCEPHPDADRLSICKVFDGSEHKTVVCGAPNVQAGMLAPYVPVGVTLVGGLKVDEREVRGVKSAGMLLSPSELGLWDDHSGILKLEPTLKVGIPIQDVIGGLGYVFDISATPNRPDILSHVGVAREVAALTGCKLVLPEVNSLEEVQPSTRMPRVDIREPEHCSRYVARVIEDVKIGPSPTWLCARLAAAGVRPINNVVDITNYILLEIGHPMHAFDLDLLEQEAIIVRMAKEGEELETLDGETRTLSKDDLVIADEGGPVALAGVMGGAGSEVTDKTTRILLESAWFEPSSVRKTARRHGLHTESSHRFERGADPRIPLVAANRAAHLISELAGGRVVGSAIDEHPRPFVNHRVSLCFTNTEDVLGYSISQTEQTDILSKLGFIVIEIDRNSAVFESPSFRTEMSREIDLIEEVARVYGYDAIPATLPERSPEPMHDELDYKRQVVISRLREAAGAAACHEVLNYSFLSKEEVLSVVPEGESSLPESRPLSLANPLSAEQSCMRTTLLVSMLNNLRHNRRFRKNDLKLYELGRVYLQSSNGVIEEPERFAALFSGRRNRLGWTTDDAPVDFYDVKGLAEACLQRAGVDLETLSFRVNSDDLPWLHPKSACEIVGSRSMRLGWLGEIHPRLAAHFDLPAGVFVLELEIEAVLGDAVVDPVYQPVARFPALLRDLAFVIDDSVPVDRVRKALMEPLDKAQKLGVRIVDASLFDVYKGPQIGEGKQSLAFAIQYQADDRTLRDTETEKIQELLLERLERDLGARLRR